jgi:hypothetical protein
MDAQRRAVGWGILHAYGPSTATWTEAQERMVFMGFT